MNDSGSRQRPARAPVLGLAALAATSALAQPPDLAPLSETIEVRVVNVDVMVTDADGVPIAGLGAEDFELLVDGKPVAIDYFTSIRDGSPLPRAGAAAGAAAAAADRLDDAADLEYKPYLAIVFDGRSLNTVGVEEVFGALRLRAEILTDSTRGVLVARHGRALRFNRGFTRQPEALRLAVDQLAELRPRAIDTSGRDILLRRLERAPPAPAVQDPDDPRGNFQIEAEATSFLGQIRAAAQEARSQNANAMNDLARFVRSLAGLPGRKCLLYLGPGFNTRPGEVLLRLWWSKYWPLAGEVGLASAESEVGRYALDEDLVRLIREASENNVSFYTFDPGGLRSLGFDASLSSLVATELVTAEVDGARRSLQSLAAGTGGIGRIDSGRLDLLLDHMTADFRTYYSLGFEPAAEAPDSGRIKVKMGHPGYRVRHLESFAARGPRRQLEARTLAALFTDEAANPLAVGVELESGEKQKDGTWVMPILLKVPLAGVTLLPRETTHVGRLQVVVIAQSAEGDLSEPAHGDMPIEIDNGELLAALGRQAGYRMRLRMRPGEQRLAIGVRDEITGEESTVNLVVDAGGPSRK